MMIPKMMHDAPKNDDNAFLNTEDSDERDELDIMN